MKSLLSLLEPEEFVGGLWHQLTEKVASAPRYPEAAAKLEDMQRSLAVLYRGLGGEPGLRIATAAEREIASRRTFRQRLAGRDRLAVAWRDGQALYLPATHDLLASREDNRALYVWLTALFAHLPMRAAASPDPARDVALLRDVRAAVEATLACAPGLAKSYQRLRAFALRARTARRLPPAETAVEQAVRALLGDARFSFDDSCAQALAAPARSYRTFAPVFVWGEALVAAAGATPAPADSTGESASSESGEKTRKGRRSVQEQTERRDYLALNRFEKLLTMAESMNLARPVEDDDADGARRAAEDSAEIVLSPHRKHAATRLKLELDLSPADAEDGVAQKGLRYPEWDWKRRIYRPHYCRVIAESAPAEGASWRPSQEMQRRIRRVRRQFEALRPRNETLRAQVDGDDLDMEAVVRSRTDLATGGTPSDRIYMTTRKQARDLAVGLLIDASLSTESFVGERRIIDIAREGALLFCHALDAGGDASAVWSFTSRGRNEVRVNAIKSFEQSLSEQTVKRIGALAPGHYTRIGAALRHASAELQKQPARHKLLLVLTDGKPNDIDHYEGRFGIEDTRRAIHEARSKGARVFGLTIDARAQIFFPALFGRGGYAIVSDAARLPTAMPLLLKHVMAG